MFKLVVFIIIFFYNKKSLDLRGGWSRELIAEAIGVQSVIGGTD
jgi:hypothetical protein